MKFLIDKEIDLAKGDYLHTISYADTLEQVIVDAPSDAGFTIGLFGQWGSGKSSVVKTVERKFISQKKLKVKFVIYDAWKYSKDSFRRMFLLHLQKALELRTSDKFDSFYVNTARDVRINTDVNWPVVVLTILIFVLGYFFVSILPQEDAKITATLIITLAGVLVNVIAKGLRDSKVTVTQPAMFAPEQFEECFAEIIGACTQPISVVRRIEKWVTGYGPRQFEKIVIVIDNIDRCDSETAFELITNIKNFLGSRKGVVFLVPVDDNALKKHIAKGKSEEYRDADEYLRKFFSVTIRIKPFKTFDLFDLVDNLNKEHKLGFDPNTVNLIAKEYATNPRRIVQFINDFIVELDFFRTKYGREFIERYEALICKALILREEWPDYYQRISMNPHLLNDVDENINKHISEFKGLSQFLHTSSSIHSSVSYRDIATIFSTHDRNSLIPDAVMNAIYSADYPAVKKQMEKGIIEPQVLINKILELLKTTIDRRTYQTDLRGLIEMICHLNEENPLGRGHNTYIFEAIKSHVRQVVQYVDDYLMLCKYAESIRGEFNYLENNLVAVVLEDLNKSTSTEEWPKVKKLTAALLYTGTVENNKGKIRNAFANVLQNKSVVLKEFLHPGGKVRDLVDETIFTLLVNKISDFGLEGEDYINLKFATDSIKLTPNEQYHFFQRVNAMHGSFDMKPIETIDAFLTGINSLVNQQEAVPDHFNAADIKVLFEKLRKYTTVSGTRKSAIMDLVNLGKGENSVRFLMNVFILSGFEVTVSTELTEAIGARPELSSIITENSNRLRNASFDPAGVRDVILFKLPNDQAGIELKMHFLFDANGTLVSPEDQVTTLLNDVAEKVRDLETGPIEFFAKLISHQAITGNIIQTLQSREEFILGPIPQQDQQVFFNNVLAVTTDDNYRSRVPLLHIMLRRGTQRQVSIIIKYLLAAIASNDVDEWLLELMEEIHLIDPVDLNELLNATRKLADSEWKKEALLILNNKQMNVLLPDGSMNIVKAFYASELNGADPNVTRRVRKAILNNKLEILSENSLVDGPDPHYGQRKFLTVNYTLNGQLQSARAAEGETLSVQN